MSIGFYITGDTGVGKELVTRAIHAGGQRASEPFVPVNCGAIPSTLWESAFFGHVRGAFTGATEDHKGHFESANRGTLFLGEIGDMPIKNQVKLLRVLDHGVVMRVGATQSKQVDIRVIAATNKRKWDDFYYACRSYKKVSDLPGIYRTLLYPVYVRL